MQMPNCIFASIPDLKCEAAGATAEEVIAIVQQDAERVIKKFHDAGVDLPKPSRLAIARIDVSGEPGPAQNLQA